MRALLEKIRASAAARLPLPAGRPPAQELGRYKTFLKVESHRLKMLHRAGAGGRLICQARAAMVDELLRYLLEAASPSAAGAAPASRPALALVALGGYGRGELNPHSDIDLMFLHPPDAVSRGDSRPYRMLVTEGLLFDMGLKVGYSMRSVEDCVQLANTDMQSKTSLLEARLIAGDAALFERLQHHVLAKCVRNHEDEYLKARVRDQEARHAKFGNSATMQEPNVKNGCGGLRDYQNLVWMAWVKYRTRTTAEMVKQDLLSAADARQLDAAYDFLLRARNELHYHVNRAVDVLSKSLQPAVALRLGYADRSPSRRLEQFMRDYFTHSRRIYLITRTVEQRLALLPESRRPPFWRELFRPPAAEQTLDGFKFVEARILAATPRVFDEQPRRLMRVFLYAQQRGLDLHPDLVQLFRRKLPLVNRAFLRDARVHDTFLQILNQRGEVAPILRIMHEIGFLGKYLPEFGRLTNLVQHEFYHQYATDEHTLVCLEKLDWLWDTPEAAYRFYQELFHGLERPFVLYLATLLHDAGKGLRLRKHAAVGSQIARPVAQRLGLDTATTEALCLLIEHHLQMAHISQRRDVGDLAVLRRFARQVQSVENLAQLTLHTVADTLATSDKLWNGFKDQLLQTLFRKTHNLLMGETQFHRSETRQREILEAEIRRDLPRQLGGDEVRAHFEHLPARYFQIHSARQILTDLALVHRFLHNQMLEDNKALEPVIHWHHEPDRGYTQAKVCTWDRARLFSQITGALSAAGLNILSAQIFTRGDGIALDTFDVTDAHTGAVVPREARERFEEVLNKALAGGVVDYRRLIARQKSGGPLYQSLEGERIPTQIQFFNDLSETHTVIEIETEDRLGLLYMMAQTLADLELDISLAKICTEKGAAIDSFYVRFAQGGKILQPEQQQDIAIHLRLAIESLDLA